MKTFWTNLIGVVSILFLSLVFTEPVKALPPIGNDITFTIANAQVTTGGTYFEFDVMAQTSSANTNFKLAQVYIDYNTDGFGFNIVSNAKVTVTRGTLLATVAGTGGDQGIYGITKADNTSSKISIANTWTFDDNSGGSTAFQVSNVLGTTPKQWVHVKIEILDGSKTSGLHFDASVSQFDLQQYYFANDYGQPDTITATNYSPVNVGSDVDNPLPVELNSFNAKVSGSNVELLWKTATEVNNHGFEVERKANDNESATWEKVGFVNGSGNSNSPKDYSFTDKSITGGSKFVYRLKQIDNDGTFTYSSNVEVEVVPDKFELFQNYPNPFNPSTTIKFSLPEDSRIVINIYNILGEKVTQLINADYKAGYYKVQLNSTDFNLASGIYFYTIESKNFKSVKKMVLMK